LVFSDKEKEIKEEFVKAKTKEASAIQIEE